MGVLKHSVALLAIFVAASGQTPTCPNTPVDNIYSVIIEADSPLGVINLIHIQYDGDRKVAVTTAAFHDELNRERNVDRVDNFRLHSCPTIVDKQTRCDQYFSMTPEQTEASGGNRYSFDRGHLVPVNAYRFSADGVNNTFYCLNIAVQDPYTNQNPWFTVEDRSHKYFNESINGFVVTGTCDADNFWSPSLAGYSIPDCFWKLICYVDGSGATQVVGFIGNNTLLHKDDSAGMTERTRTTTMARNQQEILNVMQRDSVVLQAWDGAVEHLLKNRDASGSPRAQDCRAALTASTQVKDEWSNFSPPPV